MTARLISCQKGNSFVEMALVAPLFAALLMGMVDISRAVSTKLKLVQASQRAVELVQRSGFVYANMSALETESETAAGEGSNATATAWLECGSSSTQLSFTSSCADGEAYSRHVRVTTIKPFTPLFASPYFPGANNDGTYTITGKAGIRVQ